MALEMIVPPCQAACPILTDVQEYVSLASLGKFRESFEVARATNPFVSSCGYICFHPCEEECRRADVDEAVSIMALKRAAVDYGSRAALRQSSVARLPSSGGQVSRQLGKVAIVGAGPAGLTAALDLVNLGYCVEVFEREAQAGGMLSLVIPAYRLPADALATDVKTIEEAGVKIVYGQELGQDLSLGDLRKRGFSAVVVATGLPLSRSLPVFPSDNRRILLAIPFLRALKEGRFPEIGKRVIVVGGGNVAIDVARSARRIGASEVKVICLEGREEMPAHEWEIVEASEEGAEFHCCWGPKEVLQPEGAVEGLRCRAVKSVFDAEGRFNPTYFEDKLTDVHGDTIIVAIGQMREEASGELKAVYEEKAEDVFLAGEAKEGPGSAVEAMRSGRNAAASVHLYLSGEEVPREEAVVIQALPEDVKKDLRIRDRIKGAVRPAEERRCDFEIFESGFGKAEASKEALRCLSCAAGAAVNEELCVACLTCVRVCPFKIPVIGEGQVAQIDSDKCQACGICITECPALAIEFRRNQEEELLADIERALGLSKKIEFYCQRRLFLEGEESLASDWARVRVPCVVYLSTADILKAYEWGAEKVVVSGCPEGECSFMEGQKWAQERIAKMKGILRHVGLDGESIAWRGKTT